MRTALLALVATILLSGTLSAQDADRYGFRETCDDTAGWYQWDAERKPIPIELKIRSENGTLIVPLRRSLLRFAANRSWVAPGVSRSAIICKEFGEVDLDRYHYLLCRITEKGSGVFIGINGFDTKLGYTTGLTVIDISDYEDIEKGKRNVRIELDLHENSTTLILDEIALVSELTPEEQAALIGKGVVPRKEKLTAKRYHALEAVKDRCAAPTFPLDGQEQVIYRDTATGAILTRLTASHLPDYFGEGGIWSADGACLFFVSPGRPGTPVYHLASGRVTAAPSGYKRMWSPIDGDKLFLLNNTPAGDEILVWDRKTDKTESVAVVKPPKRGGYTEFGMTPKTGRVTVAYRETPYAFVVDATKPKDKRVEFIELPTRLKGFGFSPDETMISWANCYTYERVYKVLNTGKVGIGAGFFVGHASGGRTHTVGEFGRHLKLIAPNGLFTERRPGDKIRIWANYGGDIVTDYGRLTRDAEWIVTNGTRGDVANQHVMIPTKDPGSVLRLTRYFSTYYTWNSATYSRPSPDYTKVIFMQDVLDNPDLTMVLTRRPDPPRNVSFDRGRITWEKPARSQEIAGYNVYVTRTPGRDYRKLNTSLVAATTFTLPPVNGKWPAVAVTAVEHSGLEGLFSEEIINGKRACAFFEPVRAQLTPPARIVYDGRCSDFRYVRITPGTPDEKTGVVKLPLANFAKGRYRLWLRTRGNGKWQAHVESMYTKGITGEYLPIVEVNAAAAVASPAWKWQALEGDLRLAGPTEIVLSSSDVDLSLDEVSVQRVDAAAPIGVDPRDVTPPAKPEGLKVEVLPDAAVKLTWEPSRDGDFRHFSVYAGTHAAFTPANETVIRSVTGTGIVDTGVALGATVHYKVVAFDTRMNASEAAAVSVRVPGTPFLKTIEIEDHLADHLKTVAGKDITYVTGKQAGGSYFEIPVDVPEDGWYRLWLDYTTPFYASLPVQLRVDGKDLGVMGRTFIRTHPRTVTFRKLTPESAHLFSDPVRLSLDKDTFYLTKGKHTLRVLWRYRQGLFDKVHLTNNPACRPKAYDPFVRPTLKGRGW